MKKLRVAVLFGGRSGEHEVSLRSAASVMKGLREHGRFEVLPVGIARNGSWFYGEDAWEMLQSGKLPGKSLRVAILPDPGLKGLYVLEGGQAGRLIPVDVVFPILHGTFGEDGTVQGLLELAGLPYVGAGVLGSSLGMDKILMKTVLKQSGVPVGNFTWFLADDWQKQGESIKETVREAIGYPCFVKPANLGSSVGITKVYGEERLDAAVAEASRYDRKVLIEEFLPGKEIEVSVLGNDEPVASVPGEIIPCNDFYDYNAKYIDDRSQLKIPAPLPEELARKVQELAIKTYRALDCAGLGRVDFFVNVEKEKIWVNEINTLPGFTSISMYPKLWEASGIPFGELLDKLVTLALERKNARDKLETVYSPAGS